MSQQELLSFVIERLRSLGIDAMLSGSHASSVQGEARATHDIDLVVDMSESQIPAFVAAFSEDRFYVSIQAVRDAVRARRMFNLLETTTGEKVDFWMITDTPFDQSRFARRQEIDLGDFKVKVSSPEDTVVMKLLWCQQSGRSEKQLNDVIGIYELQAGILDFDYIEKWIHELGLNTLWQHIIATAEPFDPANE